MSNSPIYLSKRDRKSVDDELHILNQLYISAIKLIDETRRNLKNCENQTTALKRLCKVKIRLYKIHRKIEAL